MMRNDYTRVFFIKEESEYMPYFWVEFMCSSQMLLCGPYELARPLVRGGLPKEVHILYGECGDPAHYEENRVIIRLSNIELGFWRIKDLVISQSKDAANLAIQLDLKGKVELL